MDNVQNMLGSILSDPESVSKLKELASQLGLDPTDSNKTLSDKSPQSTPTAKPQDTAPFDLSALSSLISSPQTEQPSGISNVTSSGMPSGTDAEMLGTVMKFMPMLTGFNKEDDSTALLKALKPFLSEPKCKRLDEASRMLRIMRLLPMLKGTGLLG